jgi:hypothetical protein
MFSNAPVKVNCGCHPIKETIPASSLGYHTNNKYANFPPLMSDGRAIIASWQPESTINAELIETNNIKSNWEYRQYLQKNAKQIMEYNYQESANDVGYYKRPIDVPSIQSNIVKGVNHTPFLYGSALDNSKPFGYASSDLKNMYLSREQLEARQISPVITQDKLLEKMSRNTP